MLLIVALVLQACSASPDPQGEAPAAPPHYADTPSAPKRVTVQPGTPVRLMILQELSTRFTRKGDLFELVVLEDVKTDGYIAIPAGTRAVGEVTRSDTKGAFGRSGKLEARMLYLKMDGRAVRISGRLGVAGKGGTTETVLTAIAVGTLAFVVTGRSAVLPEGTELVASTDRTMSLKPSDAGHYSERVPD